MPILRTCIWTGRSPKPRTATTVPGRKQLKSSSSDMDRNHIDRGLLAPPPESAMGDQELGLSLDPRSGAKAPRPLRSQRPGPRRRGHTGGDGTSKVWCAMMEPVPCASCRTGTGRRPATGHTSPSIPSASNSGFPSRSRPVCHWCSDVGSCRTPSISTRCVHFSPELVIVSAHGGAPWTSTLVQLLKTWPNLYHMISAYSPSRYPPELVAYANSKRGFKKVLFASDYPLMPFEERDASFRTAGSATRSCRGSP